MPSMTDGDGFQAIRQERVHERIARQLRARILEGAYQPGERLPHEQELIERFQVSRSAVRQAMQQLEQQGLVHVRVGSGGGAFVARAQIEPVREWFENLFALGTVDRQQFLAAKAVIEPEVTCAAVPHISEEELDHLDALVRSSWKAVEGGTNDQLLDFSLEFHRIIAGATRNSVLELMLSALIEVAHHIPEFREAPSGGWEPVVAEHEHLLQALRRRAADEVRAIMRRHVDTVGAAFPSEAPSLD